jgi:hypothetical protein
VESLLVDQMRNIDPLQIEKVNVTNLPIVNMSLQQLPPGGDERSHLPPASIGLHQVLEMHRTIRCARGF